MTTEELEKCKANTIWTISNFKSIEYSIEERIAYVLKNIRSIFIGATNEEINSYLPIKKLQTVIFPNPADIYEFNNYDKLESIEDLIYLQTLVDSGLKNSIAWQVFICPLCGKQIFVSKAVVDNAWAGEKEIPKYCPCD